MSRRIIITLLSFLFGGMLAAQQKGVPPKWTFHSVNQFGLLQGESKAAFNLQSVNGFQYHNFFVGLGAGLDYYKYKSIPLFAELRKYFGKSANQFFVYADAGVHFVWEKKNETGYPYLSTEKYSPGFYGNAGIGYKAGSKNGMGFLLSAGYSYKRVNDRQQQDSCPFSGPCYLQTNTYRYDLNRLAIQIGWMF